jgi:outer membrane protein TolC
VRILKTIGALCVVVFAAGGLAAPARAQDQSALLERMIRIVTENNPTLQSQQGLVLTGDAIRLSHSRFSVSGVSVGIGSTFWNEDTRNFEVAPGATLGFSFSISDPARVLSGYNLEREKVEARRRLEEIRNGLIKQLLDAAAELARLDNKKTNLRDLQAYLEDLSVAIERQGKAGIVETDRLWDLRERIMGMRTEIRDVESQLKILRLQTAMALGGPAWAQLLDLLGRLGGDI